MTADTIAQKRFERDVRFRASVKAIVAQSLQEHGPVNPDRADQEAHDIALRVAVRLYSWVYENDAEVMRLRIERDQYQEQSLRFANLLPTPLTLLR